MANMKEQLMKFFEAHCLSETGIAERFAVVARIDHNWYLAGAFSNEDEFDAILDVLNWRTKKFAEQAKCPENAVELRLVEQSDDVGKAWICG